MTNRLRLRALRLVGFHNYNDELIEVHGDLFVIGINESGKTAILDALHLILSGGHSFDLNAAAKMAGRRDEGRSLQGIILRADLAGNPHPDRKGGFDLTSHEPPLPPSSSVLRFRGVGRSSPANKYPLPSFVTAVISRA